MTQSSEAKISSNQKLVQEKFIVKYKSDLFDITEFMTKHPGGVNTLHGFNQKNIEEKFKSVNHSPAAEYLLNEYKINTKMLEADKKDFDESMENLIDWNSAVLPQIYKLGNKYNEWVNKPVDRNLILFTNPVLESLSKTPWYLPLVFWMPTIILLIFNESTSLDCVSICFHLVSGVFLWTLLEYLLHRFLFHMNAERYPWSMVHFLIHGLHHKVPFDENRLVFPPVPAAILTSIIYQPVYIISALFDQQFNSRLVLAGGLIGYLVYDMIHYYIHHGSPSNKYFYQIKRYHYSHHFVNHDKGFGISSPLWDEAFGTKIILRKLKYLLKW